MRFLYPDILAGEVMKYRATQNITAVVEHRHIVVLTEGSLLEIDPTIAKDAKAGRQGLLPVKVNGETFELFVNDLIERGLLEPTVAVSSSR
jgi:hypothetical protein